MSPIARGRTLAALILLGLAPATRCEAQGLPEPLPRLSEGVVIPAPPVVIVPPGGPGPTWRPGTIDPVAEARRPPGFLMSKARSWHWRRLQGKALGYPEEFAPRPLGAALYDHGRTMVANGAAARLALFRYDFIDRSSSLSPRGRIQLARAGAQLAVSPYPLIVEATPEDPALADARRYAVLAALAAGPNPVASDRVLVGTAASVGFSGTDAQIVGSNLLNRTQQYGPPIPINSNGVNSPSGVTNSVSGILPGQ